MAASVSLSTDGHIEELVPFLFRDRMIAVTFENGGCLLQLISDLNRRKNESAFVNIITPAIFELIMFFHCSFFFNNGLKKKTITVPQD